MFSTNTTLALFVNCVGGNFKVKGRFYLILQYCRIGLHVVLCHQYLYLAVAGEIPPLLQIGFEQLGEVP